MHWAFSGKAFAVRKKETDRDHLPFARSGQTPLRANTALTLAAFSLLGLAALASSASAQTTIYSNNFSAGAGSEWSSNQTDTTPGTAAHPADKFLGQFGHQTTTLTLGSLAAHSQVTASFDLYMIRSMDGNGPVGGPDPWLLTENGNTLINTNFCNAGPTRTQSFGGSNGAGGYFTGGNYPSYTGATDYTGATEIHTLGYFYNGTPADSVYHFTFTFADPSNALALNFIGAQDQDITDESWGLDNVVVETNAPLSAAPEPSETATLSLIGLGGLAVARRRKASASDK